MLDQSDIFGNYTPRTLTTDDEGYAVVVFDLDNNKVIDVYGELNSFYGYFGNDHLITE